MALLKVGTTSLKPLLQKIGRVELSADDTLRDIDRQLRLRLIVHDQNWRDDGSEWSRGKGKNAQSKRGRLFKYIDYPWLCEAERWQTCGWQTAVANFADEGWT